MTQGNHSIVLEHYEHDDLSSISLEWEVPGNSGEREPITGGGDVDPSQIPLPNPIKLNKIGCFISKGTRRVYLKWSGGERCVHYRFKSRYPDSTCQWPVIPESHSVQVSNGSIYAADYATSDLSSTREYIVEGIDSLGRSVQSDTVLLPRYYPLVTFTLNGSLTGNSVALSWTHAAHPSSPADSAYGTVYELRRRPRHSTQSWGPSHRFMSKDSQKTSTTGCVIRLSWRTPLSLSSIWPQQ